MNVLSATQAIGPAWEHTLTAFFRPFRWKRWLKFSGYMFLMQMCSMLVILPIILLMLLTLLPVTPGLNLNSTVFMVIGVTLLLFSIVAAVLFSKLWARMYFVIFASVATGSFDYRELWRKYTRHAWGWAGLMLLSMLPILLVMLVFSAISFYIAAHIQSVAGDGTIPPAMAPIAILLMYPLLFVAELVMYVLTTLVMEFTPPYMFLGGERAWPALASAWRMVMQSKGAVALYLLMKLALTIAVGLAIEIAALFVMFVLALPFAGIIFGLNSLLNGHGTVATAAYFVLMVPLVALFILCMLLVLFSMQAFMLYLLLSYAYYFLGGRYPQLGDLLEPPITPPMEPTTVTA